MSDRWTDRLSEYVDGELTAAEVAALEGHLESCDDCAAVLEEIRAVAAKAASLPELEPERDLWPGIRARLRARGTRTVIALEPKRDRRRRRVAFTVPQLAAAAVALAMLSGALVWTALDPAASVPSSEAAPAAGAAHFTAGYERAVMDLEAELAVRRAQLDPETVMVVERNLAIIEQAIAEARQALEADPSSSYLNGHLADAMRRKIDLLRRVATMQPTEI